MGQGKRELGRGGCGKGCSRRLSFLCFPRPPAPCLRLFDGDLFLWRFSLFFLRLFALSVIRVPFGECPISLHIEQVAYLFCSPRQDAVHGVVFAFRQTASNKSVNDALRGLLLFGNFEQPLGSGLLLFSLFDCGLNQARGKLINI